MGILAFFILSVLVAVSWAVPYIHNSVKKELEKGPEAVIMVSFKSANIESAYNPDRVYEFMKKIGRVSQSMTLAKFIDEGYYSELRGLYVYLRVRSKHSSTKSMLHKTLPKNTIITDIPISNLFLLRNTPGTYDLLKDREDVVEINTDQKFYVDLDRDEPASPLIPRQSNHRLKRMQNVNVLKEDLIQWNIKKIGAADIWDRGSSSRSRGQGIIYGIADTGVSYTHPVINKNYRGLNKDGNGYDHNYSWWDGVREKVPFSDKSSCPVASEQPCDDQGHGTHCLSTAVGTNGFGVAPGVKWIGCRNMDSGLGSTVTYLSCLNFFLAPHDLEGKNPRPELRPHVVGNSWACPDYEGCSKHAMTSAVEILRAAGVFMSVSAGNEGPECETIAAPPAFEPQVVTIGAVDLNDYLAPFSSRGPVKIDGKVYRKPDLVAPGVGINGAYLNNQYRRLSGTSMASPHIGGAVALMIANCPCLTRDIDRIQAILEATAVKLYPTASLMRKGKLCGDDTLTTYPNNYFGYGRLDALKAVQTCIDYCRGRSISIDLSSVGMLPQHSSYDFAINLKSVSS